MQNQGIRVVLLPFGHLGFSFSDEFHHFWIMFVPQLFPTGHQGVPYAEGWPVAGRIKSYSDARRFY